MAGALMVAARVLQPRQRAPFRGYTVKVLSRTKQGYSHKVTVGPTGEVVCTCRGFEQWGHCWASTREKEKVMTTQTESMALVPIKPEPPKTILPSKQELNIIGTIAKTAVLARGHAVPASIDSAAKAAAVMLAGHELGIKPMTALRHIFVVNGRTEPDAQIMAGIVMEQEPDALFEIVKLDDKACTMRLRRPSRGPNAVWEYTYELKDAENAGLTKKGGPWVQFPKDMMRWAATKRLCRVYAPDLINSVGTVEVRAVNELLAAADEEPDVAVDIQSLPQAQLYNDGDEEPEVPEPPNAGDNPAHDDPDPEPEPTKTPAELRTKLDKLLSDTQNEIGSGDYLTLFKGLAAFMPDGKSFDPKTVPDAQLQACIDHIRAARGEPVGAAP